jgi:hypothetical protein
MLKLFANVFGKADEAGSKLPPSLVKTVIERAVDGTDPRLRIVSGYAKTLKKPVLHAADYIIGMIDSLPGPVLANKTSLAADPGLAALLYSTERMERFISRDAAIAEYRAANPLAPGPITGLLVSHRTEKQGFGYAEVEGQTLKDVPRTTVSFDDQLLVALAADEVETRRLLKRRVFDQLLAVALLQITERKEEREALGSRKALLRSKLDIMQRGGSFTQHTGAQEKARLQARLEEIEQELAKLGDAGDVLEGNLSVIAQVLAAAEKHVWIEDKVLCLDRLYVVHDKPGPSAPEIVFKDFHNSEGRHVTLQMVNIPPA